MDANAVFALLGAAILAFAVRVFNMVAQWLSKVLGVDPPEPIHVDPATSTTTTKAEPPPPGEP
jgi:hypothetical protein